MTRRQPRKGAITQMTTSIPQQQSTTTLATATTKARAVKRRPHAAPPKARLARKGTAVKKHARRGSKTAKILDLLKRPGGVALKEIMKATEWQAHSVRGFLSGTLGK